MAHKAGEDFQNVADSVNRKSTEHAVSDGGEVFDIEKDDKKEMTTANKVAKDDDLTKQTKKLLKERSAMYNPNKDLWRRASSGSAELVASPRTDSDGRRMQVKFEEVEKGRTNTALPTLQSVHRRASSFYMDPPKARDSLSINQPASFSHGMSPLKARDSLLINQPASPSKNFHHPQVKFVPQVQFVQSPLKQMSSPSINESPPLRKIPEMPRSPLGIASAVGDELIANLISAWYWTGYYAGYKGRVSEE